MRILKKKLKIMSVQRENLHVMNVTFVFLQFFPWCVNFLKLKNFHRIWSHLLSSIEFGLTIFLTSSSY